MHYFCLIVEPVTDTARTLQRELASFDFKPCVVDSWREGMALLQHWRFDVMLLDADGLGDSLLEALRKLRRRSRAPIVLLARDPHEAMQLSWFEAGASDIVVLPASTRLIVAKIRRLIETMAAPDDEPTELSVGPLAMDTRRGTVSVAGKSLVLTTHQFELLYVLAVKLGQFVHREAIARALRSPAPEIGRSADVHIYRIRKKLRELGATGLRLDTVHRRGYCLSIDAPERIGEIINEDELRRVESALQPVR